MAKQMVCPKCKHEFTYDNGDIDARIASAKKQITEITSQLVEINALPNDERKKQSKRRHDLVKKLKKIEKKLTEFKEYRKVSDQQIHRMEYQIFKAITREYVGESVFKEIISKMEADLEAYKVSGLMKHEYTRSQHMSSVTSVNKL